jgi:hypothetical protein
MKNTTGNDISTEGKNASAAESNATDSKIKL